MSGVEDLFDSPGDHAMTITSCEPAWAQQPGESGRSFAAFCACRDLGPGRSLDRAYAMARGRQEGDGRAPGRWDSWSVQHAWVARAEAWDRHIDDLASAELGRDRIKMRVRHAALALSMQKRLADRLESLEDSDIAPGDMPRWLAEAVKVERLARGMETDEVKINNAVERELEHFLDRLEKHLPPDQYAKVLSILAEEEHGSSREYASETTR